MPRTPCAASSRQTRVRRLLEGRLGRVPAGEHPGDDGEDARGARRASRGGRRARSASRRPGSRGGGRRRSCPTPPACGPAAVAAVPANTVTAPRTTRPRTHRAVVRSAAGGSPLLEPRLRAPGELRGGHEDRHGQQVVAHDEPGREAVPDGQPAEHGLPDDARAGAGAPARRGRAGRAGARAPAGPPAIAATPTKPDSIRLANSIQAWVWASATRRPSAQFGHSGQPEAGAGDADRRPREDDERQRHEGDAGDDEVALGADAQAVPHPPTGCHDRPGARA